MVTLHILQKIRKKGTGDLEIICRFIWSFYLPDSSDSYTN